MTKKEKAAEIQRLLDHYHPEVPIPLQHQDPYTLLVAVLLSAQCTDERVNQITPSLFALADNPADMAKQPVDAIREIIKPCGLSPAKSKAIHGLLPLDRPQETPRVSFVDSRCILRRLTCSTGC